MGMTRDSNNIKWNEEGGEYLPVLEPHPICKYNKLSYVLPKIKMFHTHTHWSCAICKFNLLKASK